jgi:hypothetical protein
MMYPLVIWNKNLNTPNNVKCKWEIRLLICHVHMQIRDLFVMFMSAPRYGNYL